MNKDIEIIKIDDKDYAVIDEATYNEDTFLYLSNIQNLEDVLIRKLDKNDKNIVVPLDNEQEFEIACNLLLKMYAN